MAALGLQAKEVNTQETIYDELSQKLILLYLFGLGLTDGVAAFSVFIDSLERGDGVIREDGEQVWNG